MVLYSILVNISCTRTFASNMYSAFADSINVNYGIVFVFQITYVFTEFISTCFSNC